jgi:hypothetical protein
MRRHLLWAVPVTVTLTALTVVMIVYPGDRQADAADGTRVAVGNVAASIFLLSLLPTLILGPIALVRLRRADRARSAELEARSQAMARAGWDGARYLMRELLAGGTPPPITVWGVVLYPGERAYLLFPTVYSRFYGGGGSYVHVSGMFIGSLPFTAAGLAMTAMGNASRRRAAIAAAAYQWREQQRAQVILTDRRLICNANGRWLSFDYTYMTAFYPEPENWSVVFDFPTAEPLRLVGQSSPAIAAFVAWALNGQRGLIEHPGLEPLRRQA